MLERRARSLVAPLLRLVEKAEDPAIRDKDGALEFASGGPDELQVLAAKLTLMVQELKEADARLFENERLTSLGEMIAGVAHELNTPLTTIQGYSAMMLNRAPEEWQQDQEVEKTGHRASVHSAAFAC